MRPPSLNLRHLSPLLLLAAALVALLAVFTVHDAPPAQAQSTTPAGAVWSATLTVVDSGSAGLGCTDRVLGLGVNGACDPSEALTDDEFTLLDEDYEIENILSSGGTVLLEFNKAVPVAFERLTLHDGSGSYSFSEYRTTSSILFSGDTPSWSAGDVLQLSLTLPPQYPGDLDPDFGIGGKVTTAFNTVNSRINGMAVQDDGKIVVAGWASNGTNNDFALARYNPDGSLDTSFGTDGKVLTPIGSSGDEARGVAIQSDGKIVAAGISYSGTSNDFAVVRYTADGALDTTFSSDGKLTTDFGTNTIDSAYAVAIQSDGKIVVAGQTGNDFGLARYTTAGALDTTFDTDGKVVTSIAATTQTQTGEDRANAVAIQSDGKIIAAGYATGANKAFAMVRYTTAGALDNTFDTDGRVSTNIASGADDAANAMAIQSDGKIVLAGYYNDSTDDIVVVRYTTAGARDTSFGDPDFNTGAAPSGYIQDSRANAVAIDPDGRIVVAGYGSSGMVVESLTADGSSSIDNESNFEFETGAAQANAVALLDNGNILAAGHAGPSATAFDFALARFDDEANDFGDLPLVEDFGIGGRVITTFGGNADVANAVAVQSDGKIVAVGYANDGTDDDVALSRYEADGYQDTGFGTDGRVTSSLSGTDRANAVAVQFDGKILVAGYYVVSGNDSFLLGRFNANGSADTTFGVTAPWTFTSFTGDHGARAHALAVQSDGKIILAGYASNGADDDFALARFTSAGALDTGFGANGKVTTDFGSGDDKAYAVALQSDGKIVVAGEASDGTHADFALARYNADGSLDTGFGTSGKVTTSLGASYAHVRGMALQSDGKIVVAGYTFNGTDEDIALARFTSAGALDTGFGTGGKVESDFGSYERAYGLALQPDDKILVAGRAVPVSPLVNQFALARYRADGAPDLGFGAAGDGKTLAGFGGRSHVAFAIALQSDGKPVLAGEARLGGANSRYQDFALARFLGQGTYSDDATLSALAVTASTDGAAFNAATLSPAFDAGVTAYTVELAEGVTHVKVRPTAGHAGATLLVVAPSGSRETLGSGSASGPMAVSAGNTVDIRVTAEDGRTLLTYTLTFTGGGAGGAEDEAPSAQVGGAIWSATLTIRDIRGGGLALGCGHQGAADARCDVAKTLTEDTHTLGGAVVTIDVLFIDTSPADGPELVLSLEGRVPSALRHGATLVFDGRAFRLAEAELSSDGDTLRFTNTGIGLADYAAGQVVQVSLAKSIPPPDASNWRPALDLRSIDRQTRGCRNGVTSPYYEEGGLYYGEGGVECSDPAVLGLDGFSHTRASYGREPYTTSWKVRELYVAPSGEQTSWGATLYELVLVTGGGNGNPAPPRSFALTINGRKFNLASAAMEPGDGRVTYRWPLPLGDVLSHDNRVRWQVGFNYFRAGLDKVRVHYDAFPHTDTEVWSAALTAQSFAGGAQAGCANTNANAAKRCSTAATLTDDDFTTADGTQFAVTTFGVSGTLVIIVFDTVIPAGFHTLYVKGTALRLADAATSNAGTQAVWTNTGLAVSPGKTVQLRLKERVYGTEGAFGFGNWTIAQVSAYYASGLIAYLPAELPNGQPTTHAKLKTCAATPGGTVAVAKGTYMGPPAASAFVPLACGDLSQAIELESVSSYTHVYVRVTNGNQVAVHRIIIDPPPRTYSLTPEVSVTEGGDALVTLTLSSPATTGGVTFDVTVAHGDGGADEYDVGRFDSTVTVPQGETTAVIRIPTLDDAEVEDLLDHEERFTVSVAHDGGYPAWAEDPDKTATSVVTIIDNDEAPGGTAPWSIRIVPGDGKLTVAWRMGDRPGWEDADVRHALRWSQVSGVWANPRDPRAVGRNDGIATEPGAISFVITGLDNDVPTGVFVRSFPGNRRTPDVYNVSERNPSSSEWVRLKGELTTPRAPRQRAPGEANNPPTVLVAIGDVTIVNESGTSEVSLSAVFVDEDRDPLTVTAASSDTAVAAASVSADHSTLTLTAKARGTATITVTANDGNGGTVDETFTVKVKAAPTLAKAIADVSGAVVGTTRGVSLSGVFSDADGDALTITTASSDTSVASVGAGGAHVTLVAEAEGTATVTVTARDSDGNTVSDEFDVTVVKTAPVVAQAIADVSGLTVGDTRDVSLSGVFSDADGDSLTITAASSDEAKATVSVASDGSTLTLTGVAEGAATVTVTARDPDGNEVSDAFDVSLAPAPEPGEKDYSELIATMYDRRDNSQWSSLKSHTDRWDRALLAFGETVEDKTLTPMTADEAQAFADRGWVIWEEVAAALREIEQAQQQQQQAPANNAPTVASAIADATIVNASGTRSVSLSGVFSDADGDSLTITAASSDTAKATASVAADYSTLTVSAAARGAATITVTANDGNGGTVEDTFTVTVKAAPTVASAIADVSGLEAGDTRDVSLSGVFSDADGDSLTITAASSDTAKATVSVASDGSRLTLTGVDAGTATVTVTARDSDGNTVSDEFDVTVVEAVQQQQAPANNAPTVASAIADVSGLEAGDTRDVSLSGVFSDADGDSLTITAASSDTAKATVSVASDGSKLTLAGVAEGTATVTVTANDGNGGTVSDEFQVGVAKKYAALIVRMWEWRNDPARINNAGHTDLWDRALLAFGETVEDASLTPMTAAEAQTYADRGWNRWVPVAKALKELEGG